MWINFLKGTTGITLLGAGLGVVLGNLEAAGYLLMVAGFAYLARFYLEEYV